MTPEAPARLRPRLRLTPGWGVGAVVAVLVAVAVFVVEPVRVSSRSMEPTLGPGDQLLVLKWGDPGDPGGAARRGELVVVDDPQGGGPLVKRVAAVGGDTVGLEDGRLVVDGVAQTEPYVDAATMVGTFFGPVEVPRGTVFLLGDNRADSLDSRRFGPVPLSSVEGRVVARVWPVGR